jgi:hypothetical protein
LVEKLLPLARFIFGLPLVPSKRCSPENKEYGLIIIRILEANKLQQPIVGSMLLLADSERLSKK